MDISTLLVIQKQELLLNNKEEAKVIADPQNRWTEIRKEGIDTGNKQTTISSESTVEISVFNLIFQQLIKEKQ